MKGKSTSASAFVAMQGSSKNKTIWNFNFNKSTKTNDSLKLIFKGLKSPKEDLINKTSKENAELNECYCKLIKEENDLLFELRKLQVKKQLLIKKSKQLKYEQIIKLKIDLQNEKEIRNDLEKKLSNLEKKLNQLEKEIDDRNKSSNNSVKIQKTKNKLEKQLELLNLNDKKDNKIEKKSLINLSKSSSKL